MNVLAAILSVISFIVSCGSAGYNSTYQMITKNPTVEVKKETQPASQPEVEKSHTLTADFYGVDNKGSGWGFVKKKGMEPEICKSTAEMFATYSTFYLDPKRTKNIYLTFDEGYENGYTATILDILKEEQVPAAFFITAPYLEKETALVDRMVAEGHIVGNHTVNHPNLHKLQDPQKIADELGGLNREFFSKYGKNMQYLRPPEGEYSRRVLAVAQSLGYKTILWSFAYKDWDTKNQKGKDYAFNQVTPYLHDGAILLLHAVSKDNTEALRDIIKYAREQGYSFKSLDELE